jgi:hypothetical protein
LGTNVKVSMFLFEEHTMDQGAGIPPSVQRLAIGDWLNVRGFGVRVSALARFVSGSGAHPAAYCMGIAGKAEADHTPPTCAGVRNTLTYTYGPPYVSMAKCLIS